MKVVYINLERSLDRRHAFLVENSHMAELDRFAAVDGAWADRQALEASGVIRNPLVYSDGAIGALLSHMTLWRRCIEQDSVVTIAEDDALFHRSFDDKAARMLAEAGDFDMIFWGWNFDAGLVFELLPGLGAARVQFDEETMRQGLAGFQSLDPTPQLFKLLSLFGLCCYSVSPKGARHLFSRLLPITDGSVFFPELNRSLRNYGIDVMLNAVYREMDVRVCFPPLVVTRNELGRSTIQA